MSINDEKIDLEAIKVRKPIQIVGEYLGILSLPVIVLTVAERDALIREVERQKGCADHNFKGMHLLGDLVDEKQSTIDILIAVRNTLSAKVKQLQSEATTLQRVGEEMVKSLKATKSRLQDWMRTTGFGEIYWKDREALKMVTSALTAWQKARGKE